MQQQQQQHGSMLPSIQGGGGFAAVGRPSLGGYGDSTTGFPMVATGDQLYNPQEQINQQQLQQMDYSSFSQNVGGGLPAATQIPQMPAKGSLQAVGTGASGISNRGGGRAQKLHIAPLSKFR